MTTITALPSAPNRSTDAPEAYVTKADAMMAALPTFITETNTVAGEVNTNATTATTQAGISTAQAVISTTQAGISTTQAGISTTQAGISTTQAAAAAASATTAANAPGTSATSTTSLTIGTGSQSLTIQTGKSLIVGMPIIIARTSDPALQKMQATITAYNSGTGSLTATVPVGGTTGSGTYTDWTISLVGATGATGAAGATIEPIYTKTALTLLVNYEYKLDSTDAAFTVTMPLKATATLGDTITLLDPLGTWATNNVTVNRSDNSFIDPFGAAQAEDIILDQDNMNVTLFYDDTNWRLI